MIGSAGDRNKKLYFQDLTEDQDSAGGAIEIYNNIFDRWGSLKTISSDEKYVSTELIASVTHKIVLLYDSKTSKLTNKNRCTHGARIFDIASVINYKEESKYIVIVAKELIF